MNGWKVFAAGIALTATILFGALLARPGVLGAAPMAPQYGNHANLPGGLLSGDLSLTTDVLKTVEFFATPTVISTNAYGTALATQTHPVRAQRLFIYAIDTNPGAAERKFHIGFNSDTAATGTTGTFPLIAGDSMLSVDFPVSTLTMLLETAGDSVTVYILAFGNEEMSNTISY